MLKVIIDTNVFVSSLIQHNYPFLVVDYIFKKRSTIELCVSEELQNEYSEVLSRIKFFRYSDYDMKSKILLANIDSFGCKYLPSVELNIIQDKSDNKFLELSETCNADYLITGNTKHFPMKEYKNTKIVSPKEFWELRVIKSLS
jgi:putative PIN family toxin of toxin-antitoxin system